MPRISDEFAADIRRALIVRDAAPTRLVRESGWQTLLLHRAQRRAGHPPALLPRFHSTPDGAA